MFKLLRHTKNAFLSVTAIIVLLFAQAVCDLTLPQYTSKIVNVGIQQGGIEHPSPKAITAESLEFIKLFMSAEETAAVESSYSEITKDNFTDKEYSKLQKEYPQLSEKTVYLRNSMTEKELQNLDSIMATPELIAYSIENGSDEMKQMQEAMIQQIPNAPADMDIKEILAVMPQEQKAEITQKINETFSQMPESIIEQSAVYFVKDEYVKLGVNTDSVQNNYIIKTGVEMLLIALFVAAASISVALISSRFSAALGRDIRKKVFSNVVGFSSNEFDKFSTASLITRSTNDIQQVQFAMVMLLRMVFYAPIMGIGGIIKVFNTNVDMVWIIGLTLAVVLTVVITMFAVVLPKFKIVQKLIDRVNLVAREILTGLNVIRAFSTEKHEEKRFDGANRDLVKLNLFVNRTMAVMMPFMMFIMNAVSILIIWEGGKQVDIGAMQVGDLMAFIQYAMHIIMSFVMISMLSVALPRAMVSANRINEIIETESSVKDSDNIKAFNQCKKGVVEFKDVSFRYPQASENVLENISFTANPGETTAVIGSTGSGKSTLVNLIPRFFDVTEGQILVDGVDIREASQHDLRSRLGIVPQKGVLFSGTIESNIKYGAPNINQGEVEEAARIAQAENFIEEKEEKYQSAIAQGGSNVSGGQKQRLAIARAIAKKPEIYIFDDSFSALDFKTDVALRKALNAKTKDSTVIIVAQRISTIMRADQIIVLDEGKIVGKGTHAELLKTCEVYSQIASSQLSKEELAQ